MLSTGHKSLTDSRGANVPIQHYPVESEMENAVYLSSVSCFPKRGAQPLELMSHQCGAYTRLLIVVKV
jgi:hypothetical protein